MARTGVDIRGADRLAAVASKLERLDSVVIDELASSVGAVVAHHVEGPAQEKAPRDTGALGQSMNTTAERIGQGIRVSVVSSGLANAYAEVQHERRDYIHAHGQDHFLHSDPSSAWEENEAEVRAALGDLLVQAFEQAVG